MALVSLPADRSVNTDFSGMSEDDLRALFSASLGERVHGLCFSPYREGQTIGDILSEHQIRERIEVIAPHTRWVRSFSCTDGNEHVPRIARQYGLETMVGAWIGRDREANEREIAALIELARAGHVGIAAVGNEVLLRGDLSQDELIAYVDRVKKALPGIAVGCVDAYNQFIENPELVQACDVILANCYPFWEGYDVAEAPTRLQQMHAAVVQVAQGKPVIVTETGWPSEGSPVREAVPSPVNVMKYFVDLNAWSRKYGVAAYYFSSFDESWKVRHEGDVGQRWGIWDTAERNKYTDGRS